MKKQDLLNLIEKHPDAEIMIRCAEESCCEDYYYTYHFEDEVSCFFENFAVYGEKIYSDEAELRDDLDNDLFDITENMDDYEYEKFIDKEMEKHPFMPYIVICVG